MAAAVDVSGIVLAGGRSSRMGRDKATLLLGGVTMLQRTVSAIAAVAGEVVIVGAPGQRLPDVAAPVPVRRVFDAVAGEGPLAGMAAGLAACRGPRAVVVAVDMPFVQEALLRLLLTRLDGEHRWAVPEADGRAQPLCSAVDASVLDVMRERLAAGDRAPMRIADAVGCVRVPPEHWRLADPGGRSFLDADTPGDLAALEALLAADRASGGTSLPGADAPR